MAAVDAVKLLNLIVTEPYYPRRIESSQIQFYRKAASLSIRKSAWDY